MINFYVNLKKYYMYILLSEIINTFQIQLIIT